MSERITTGLDNPIFAGRLRVNVARPRVDATPKPAIRLMRGNSDISDITFRELPSSKPKQEKATAAPIKGEVQKVASKVVEPEVQKPVDFAKSAKAWKVSSKPSRGHSTIVSRLLVGFAVVLFVAGSFVAWQAFSINKQFEPAAAQAAANPDDDRDEKEPAQEDIMNYQVVGDMPRFIRITKTNTFSRVLHLGVDAEKRMATPTNIFDTGWFNQSEVPGSGRGAAVIGGHVSGPTKPGVFNSLNQLVAGDEIEIERGDGQKVYYSVVSKESLPVKKVNMQKVMSPIKAGKAGLSLITCSGSVDGTGRHFTDRLIVYAVQK